jgi:rRNA-processing protein FCF1
MVKFGKNYIELAQENFNEILIPSYPKNVMLELQQIASKDGKLSKQAKLALQIISKFKEFPIIEGKTDELLLDLCNKFNGILATADEELMHKAYSKNIPVAFIKKNGKIVCFKD